MYDVNLIAVLAAAVSQMVVGGLWYSPLLFAKPWMALMKIAPESIDKKEGNKAMAWMLPIAVLQTSVMAVVFDLIGVRGAMEGAQMGVLLWLGFVAVTMFQSVLFEQKPIKLWVINAGNMLVTLIISGAILGQMR